MQLNVLFTKSCVHSCKFIISSTVATLVISLSQIQNGRIWWWEWVRKNWKTVTKTEAKTESQYAATTPWSLWRNRWVQKRGPVANETNAWPSWEMTISLPSMTEVFKTSLTSSNSFSVHFADLTLLTLCCTIESRAVSHSIIYGCHVPHLLSVMRTCQFKGYWDAHARHTQRVCTPSSVTYCISTFPEVDQTWEA